MRPNKNGRIKKPTTPQEQIEIFKNKSLKIKNNKRTIDILSRINYYRFTAYTLTLKHNEVFKEGTTFEDIYSLYEFDRKLRALLIGNLEVIEVAFRSQIASFLAHTYGSMGYLNAENFINPFYHEDMVRQLNLEILRSKEVFVNHHKRKYDGMFPVWVVIEVTSFSLLSKVYSNMKNRDKATIAKKNYQIPYEYIKNWLYSLSTLRNICAHYGRVYSRRLPIHLKIDEPERRKGIKGDTVFAAIFIMGKLMLDKGEWDSFIISLSALLENYEVVNLAELGFPANWEKLLRSL
ncbi:ABC transporter permease [Bacillus sp. J14TS2]|uniref:Abi family protein n=1 Tax=Bacillus sp. J14TS2 TaxID=2807188 RepID=UPI001B28D0FA|nr:Abi family protein [Bacillus sp. J14TS2]GIN73173.1 ABC transporter permease [Bacillus sp. J14TS2]